MRKLVISLPFSVTAHGKNQWGEVVTAHEIRELTVDLGNVGIPLPRVHIEVDPAWTVTPLDIELMQDDAHDAMLPRFIRSVITAEIVEAVEPAMPKGM